MTTSYRIDIAHRLVISRGAGVVNGAELTAHAQTLRVDPRFDPEFRQLLDFSNVERVISSYAAIRGMTRIAPFARTARRVAVIQQDVVYGLFRMYELLLDGPEGQLSAVKTLDAAFDLLDISAADREAVMAPPDREFDAAAGVE